MPPTVSASGTLSTTGSATEDFVNSPNAAGTYVLDVDADAMTTAHVIEVRVYKMVLSGGTAHVAQYARVEGMQVSTNNKVIMTVPISTGLAETNALRFSIACNAAGVSLPWSVTKFA